MLPPDVAAVAQGASFDDLFSVMQRPLKPQNLESTKATIRHLLRELVRDGLVVHDHGCTGSPTISIPNSPKHSAGFRSTYPDPVAEPYGRLMVPVKRRA
jgi:hypothetical protein